MCQTNIRKFKNPKRYKSRVETSGKTFLFLDCMTTQIINFVNLTQCK